ncbi:MAG: TlpA family protein disulfide reductase [Thiovulaceae bacterium]|nr:TlpA family protein disulfide reductase [Sulfurimonadaceae bacterium]
MIKILITMLLMVVSLYAENRGKALSNFDFPYVEQTGTYGSSDIKGKVVLINFWASWCGSCKREMPLLESLAKKYEKKPFKVIPINLDRKKAFAQKYLDQLKKVVGDKLHMVMLFDKEKILFKKHPSQGYPYTLLVDKQGTIVADYLGSFDEKGIEKLEEKINELLK